MILLRLGTRGSALALAQANQVKALLEAGRAGLTVEIVVIRTTGDRMQEAPPAAPPGKGIFIKEIEEALLEKRVDLAVHSMKDLPTDQPGGLSVAAVLEREDPRDCLISRFGELLRELPRGSIVGTSSPRRRAQLKAFKKHIGVAEMNGNLDTRLRKLQEGDVTSIVVAHAGVRRLRRQDEVTEVLEPAVMLPAPAQGCIAVETRADDAAARDAVLPLNHLPSARAAAAERGFLAELGGGCAVPVAAHAREESGALKLDGLVIAPDGGRQVRGTVAGAPADAARLGAALARELLSKGAADLLRI